MTTSPSFPASHSEPTRPPNERISDTTQRAPESFGLRRPLRIGRWSVQRGSRILHLVYVRY